MGRTTLDWLVRKGLSGEVVYQQRLERGKELSVCQCEREIFHGRGESGI